MLNTSIIRWLNLNVYRPKKYDYFFPAVLVALFPNLSLTKGIYLTPEGKRNCHYWAEGKNTVYGAGKIWGDRYIQIKPVKCELPQIVTNSNFSLLPLEDQFLIVTKWSEEKKYTYDIFNRNIYAKERLEAGKTISPVFLGANPVNYLGVYIEHSDFPNVAWGQVGKVFIFETLGTIDPGEKLTINHKTFPKEYI